MLGMEGRSWFFRKYFYLEWKYSENPVFEQHRLINQKFQFDFLNLMEQIHFYKLDCHHNTAHHPTTPQMLNLNISICYISQILHCLTFLSFIYFSDFDS